MLSITTPISKSHSVFHGLLRKTDLWRKALLVVLGYFGSIGVAHAATGCAGGETADFSFFNTGSGPETMAVNQGNAWLGQIAAMGRTTFIILATLEIAWAAAMWAMEKDNMSSFMAEFIQKIMFIGFFYILLQNAPEWIPIIIKTFRQVGTDAIMSAGAGSCPGDITTDKIIATGFAVVKLIWRGAPHDFFGIIGKLGQIIVAVLVTIVAVIAYIIVAAQLLCLNIEAAVLLAAGAIFLGLGASRWTNDYVTKYLTYTMTVGMRLLVLLLILGLTQTFVDGIGATYTFDFEPMLKVMAMAIMTAVLALKAPEMASSLMTGQSSGFTAGGMHSGMQTMVSTPVKALSTPTQAAVKGTVGVAKGVGSVVSSATNAVKGLGK